MVPYLFLSNPPLRKEGEKQNPHIKKFIHPFQKSMLSKSTFWKRRIYAMGIPMGGGIAFSKGKMNCFLLKSGIA